MKANLLALTLLATSPLCAVSSFATEFLATDLTIEDSNLEPTPNSEICKKYNGQSYTLKASVSGSYQDFCRIGDGPNWGDGALVGEKTLAMLDNGQTPLAAKAFLRYETYTHRAGNPSFHYCQQLGGQTVNYITIFNGQLLGETGFCTFTDGSMIGGWTLFRHTAELEAIFQANNNNNN